MHAPSSRKEVPPRPTPGPPRLKAGLARQLRAVVGREGVITEPDRLLAYESDALTYLRGPPLAVVLPRSAGELRDVVRILADARVPIVPRGAGTGLSGGAVATEAVLVSTMRMNHVLRVDPEDRYADVEPGVVTAAINTAAAAHGLRYLPDPASAEACTIGGNVAENAGGPHCLKHGVTSDHVLELEVVLPNGKTLMLGRGAEGSLDVASLLIGSEGTLGIASRVRVRLVPEAVAVRTALALFDRLQDAAAAVSELLSSGVTPVAIELIDGATIRMVEDSVYAIGLPTDLEAALIVEVEGFPREVEAEIEAATVVARRCGARDVRLAADEEERATLWHARKKAFGALGRQAPEVLIQDAAVPRTALPDVLARTVEIAATHGLEVVNYFHAGDGNLHPHLLFDPADQDQVARVKKAAEEMMRACVEAGGTITGEHGVGLDKRDAMRLIFQDEELDALRHVKAAFDPAGLCNPGKLLPD